MRRTELAIVGAGPGGLAAAREAVAHGIAVVLFDDTFLPGGQLLKQPPPTFRYSARSYLDKERVRAASLLEICRHPLVKYRPNATVWGMFEERRIAYVQGVESGSIQADFVIVSTGAFDRPVPFPGWTLPGVLTAGGVLNLLKGQRVLAGKTFLLSGSGPLLMLAACALRLAGAQVVEVLEASRPQMTLHRLLGLSQSPWTLIRGLRYLSILRQAGIPLRLGQIVTEARGMDGVQELMVSPVDRSGRVHRSRCRMVRADTLVLGFGLTPSVEFTRHVGCRHQYDPVGGAWIPIRSFDLETSVPGLFAVGDCAGVRGGEAAMLEGRLAAMGVARRLGRLGRATPAGASAIRRRLGRLDRFHRTMAGSMARPETLRALVTDDTVICRCEEVTAGELLGKIREGIHDMNTLKALTRTGMGRCQGRNCLSIFASLLACELGCPVGGLSIPRARPPLKPIPISDLLHEELPPPTPPEMALP